MKLKCRIHSKDYYEEFVVGATFSEEFNETLDSGAVFLAHIAKIKKLRPYDDVFIWNSDDEFNGYENIGDEVLYEDYGASANIGLVAQTPAVPVDPNEWEECNGDVLVNLSGRYYLAGDAIDIWAYLFFDNPNSKRYTYGYNSLILKFNLIGQLHIINTNYQFPLTRTASNCVELGDDLYEIRLENVLLDGESANPNAPQYIWIQLNRKTPNFADYYVRLRKKTLSDQYIEDTSSFSIYQFASESRPFTGDYWISSIQKVSGTIDSVTYNYQYNRLIANTELNGLISGLPKKELLTTQHMSIKTMIKGNTFNMTLKEVVNNLSSIDFYFEGIFYKPLIVLGLITGQVAQTVRLKVSFAGLPQNNNFNVLQRDATLLKLTLSSGWVPMEDLDNADFDLCLDEIFDEFSDASFLIQTPTTQLPKFFKHLLVDTYSNEMVDLEHRYYKYKIDLMSETKGLEAKVCPNISITQPISPDADKRTIRYYMEQFLDLYSPKIKKKSANNKWRYVNKYHLDMRDASDIDTSDPITGVPLSAIFTDKDFAPEMTLTAPTLREVLSRLMIVKDCIPVVKNDVVYAMKISETHGTYIADDKHVGFIHEGMNSSGYATSFRREYQNAISQENSAHFVEYAGFRNPGTALMQIENMEIQTRFPIYKINKMYMCYYKKIIVRNKDTHETYNKVVLVQQDISKLVLENTVRNTMPADWTKYPKNLTTYEDLAKYKILTVGYDIGSNRISGWGTKFEYIGDLLAWTQKEQTYIEVLMDNIENFYPLGITKVLEDNEEVYGTTGWKSHMIAPTAALIKLDPNKPEPTELGTLTNNIAIKLKCLMFKIDYNAMYNGTLIHSKDNVEDDSVMVTDNCSGSLSVLEVDGLNAKEKINRLGNPTKSWNARYDDYEQMNDEFNNVLGSLMWDADEEQNIVVYHRQYQIFDDCILANFEGAYDYVMRNYFTAVFAKYRTYSYASYLETVDRKENDHYLVLLSDAKQYFEADENTINEQYLLSGFSKTLVNADLTLDNSLQINYGYFSFDDGNVYFSDVNQFVSGYSLCFNIRMYDPLTAGIYIDQINCFDNENQQEGTDTPRPTNYVGSAQQWYVMPVKSDADGFLEVAGCYFGRTDMDYFKNVYNDESVANQRIRWSFELPLEQTGSIYSNLKFGAEYHFCKDNKELIDFTLQYEFVNMIENGVMFSEWLAKLSSFNSYLKLSENTEINTGIADYGNAFMNYFSTKGVLSNLQQIIVLRIDDNLVEDLKNDNYQNRNIIGSYHMTSYEYTPTGVVNGLAASMNCSLYIKLTKINTGFLADASDNITVECDYGLSATQLNGLYPSAVLDTASISKTRTLTFTRQAKVQGTTYQDFVFVGYIIEDVYPFANSQYFYRITRGQFSNGKAIQNTTSEGWTENISTSNAIPLQTYLYNTNDPSAYGAYLFPKTMFVLISKKEIAEENVYAQYKADSVNGNIQVDLPSHLRIQEIEFSDVFGFDRERDTGRPYIYFKNSPFLDLEEDDKSVQYWFWNNNYPIGLGTEKKANGSGDRYMHFVFGVDLAGTEPMETKKIFVSIVRNRNEKVYDSQHNEVGLVMNFADAENADEYGEQLFVPYEEED